MRYSCEMGLYNNALGGFASAESALRLTTAGRSHEPRYGSPARFPWMLQSHPAIHPCRVPYRT